MNRNVPLLERDHALPVASAVPDRDMLTIAEVAAILGVSGDVVCSKCGGRAVSTTTKPVAPAQPNGVDHA